MRICRGLLLTVLAIALAAGACTGAPASAPAEEAQQAPPEPAEKAQEAAPEPVKLTFWNYWDGKNGEVIEALVDRYNQENPNVQIENVFIGWGDLLPKLFSAAAGGDTPDLAAGDLVWMPKLAQTGAIVALDDYIRAANVDLNDFYSELLEVNRYGGKLYGLPVSANNLELFYNKELMATMGLDPEAPPRTWEELREHAAQCTDESQGIYGMELFTEPGEGLTWQFQVYLWQAGAEFLTDDLKQAAFNSAGGKKALQYWVDLLHSDKSAPLAPWGQFGQGKVCMVMDGSWMVGIWSAEPPFDFGTARMAVPSDGEPATNMGGEQIFVFETTPERQQAAFDFIAWFTSPEVQVEWDKQTGFMPVREAVATSPDYLNHIKENEPRALPFVESQKYARNRPPVANYPELSDAFSRELERALIGEADVDEALAAAETAVNQLLASE